MAQNKLNANIQATNKHVNHTWAWVLATEGGPAWRLAPGGGSAEGGLFSKNLIHRGGSSILKISEGGLYISLCKTPILFIVLPQF